MRIIVSHLSRKAGIPVLACLLALPAFPQGLTSLRGVVMDMTGAVVPDAEVTLESLVTGYRLSVRSDAEGAYAFLQIRPGRYRVSAAASGFKPVGVELELLVNTPATANLRFAEVGNVTETVTVEATAAQVNTTDASLGNSLSNVSIVQLPLDSRNVVGLLRLQPGVTDEGAVNGGKTDQGNVTLDGVDVNDQQDRFAFTSVLRTTLDSVQEFRVTTLNFTADQGRTSGAQVALVTKGGTNELHGSAYWYHRNTATAANDFFMNRAGLRIPRLIRNMVGGSVGGPIVRNRAFYFLNFETTLDASEGTRSAVVPMAHVREGYLRYRRTDGSVRELTPEEVRTLVDPAGIGSNPEVMRIMKLFPLPNDPFGGDGVNTLGYRFSTGLRRHTRTYISRLDYTADSAGRHSFFARGNLQNDRSPGMPNFPGQPPATVGLNNSKGLAVGYTGILRPNLINTFRYGLTRQGVETSGFRRGGEVITGGPFPNTTTYVRLTPVHTIANDVAWTKDRHQIQFGGVFRAIRNRTVDYSWALTVANRNVAWIPGAVREFQKNLPDMAPAGARTFADTAMDLLGILTFADVRYLYDKSGKPLPQGSPKDRTFAANETELYIQDTWRISRGLTATGGLRWSLFPPIYEANGYQSILTPSASRWLEQRRVLAQRGRPQYEADTLKFVLKGTSGADDLYRFHKKNLSPRIALAYSPQSDSGWVSKLTGGAGNSVIRAGFGMYYDLYGQSLIRVADQQNLGFSAQLTGSARALTLVTAPRVQVWDKIPGELLKPPPPTQFPIVPQTPLGAYFAIAGVDYDFKPPYTYHMNLSVGRQFKGGLFAEASYVGRLSRRSLAPLDVAQPLNLYDPKSGQSYFQAAQQLVALVEKKTPVAQVPPIPFWENLWPAAAGGGLTATQRIYQVYRDTAPDWGASSLFLLDTSCEPACSIYGPGALVNTTFNSYSAWSSVGWGSYHALQFVVRKPFRRGFLFDFNYTFSKSLDITSSEERVDPLNVTEVIINTSDYRQQFARSTYNYPHLLNAHWVWQLPVGKGQKYLNNAGRLVDALLGGWQLSGIFWYRSGRSITPLALEAWITHIWIPSFPVRETGNVPKTEVGRNIVAPDGRSGPGLFPDPKSVWSLYRYARPGEAGNTRNELTAPTYTNFDVGLGKRFVMPYSEAHSVQFRAEAFNVFNTTHFSMSTLNLNITRPENFGKITSSYGSRVLQFAVRYEW